MHQNKELDVLGLCRVAKVEVTQEKGEKLRRKTNRLWWWRNNRWGVNEKTIIEMSAKLQIKM